MTQGYICHRFYFQGGILLAVILKDLIADIPADDMRLLAGKKGLGNIVRWCHMVENEEISDFLEGGEVAFTTGIGLNKNEDLFSLVRQVYKNKASAMVINIGPFIKSIDDCIIEFAEQNDFPIFQVPWRVHMAGIMRSFSFAIITSEQNSMEIGIAFKNAIFFPAEKDLYLRQLQEKSFLPEGEYCVAAIQVCSSNFRLPVSDARLETLKILLDSFLLHSYKTTSAIIHKNYFILVMSEYKDTVMKTVCNAVSENLSGWLEKGECFFAGSGCRVNALEEIHKSYTQAYKIMNLQKHNGCTNSICFYDAVGIYKLLIAIDDMNVVQNYYDETAGLVRQYDKLNQSDLSKVLECYLRHNGSVQDTAVELHMHKNTINYKIKKISDSFGLDISDISVKVRMAVGFMLADMYDNLK